MNVLKVAKKQPQRIAVELDENYIQTLEFLNSFAHESHLSVPTWNLVNYRKGAFGYKVDNFIYYPGTFVVLDSKGQVIDSFSFESQLKGSYDVF